MQTEDKSATVYGLVSAFVLSNIPPEWVSFGWKLAAGTLLAVASGFAYKLGEWAWGGFIAYKWRKKP